MNIIGDERLGLGDEQHRSYGEGTNGDAITAELTIRYLRNFGATSAL
jgi:hypothetical protein